MFQHEAHGEGDDEVNTESAIPKSISSSETFLFDTNDYEEISAAISAHAHDV
jgi:nucleotidyltransferase/DNA polymerase involved in DNA repair